MTLTLADQADLADRRAKREAHAVERAAKIFGLLSNAANTNDKCPGNKLLRERFGIADKEIDNVFHFLVSNGMIRVERGRGWRVVTIVASGRRTRR